MNESNPLQSLGQVSAGEAAEILRDHLRGCVRQRQSTARRLKCRWLAMRATAIQEVYRPP